MYITYLTCKNILPELHDLKEKKKDLAINKAGLHGLPKDNNFEPLRLQLSHPVLGFIDRRSIDN